jgi:hypothetical protein
VRQDSPSSLLTLASSLEATAEKTGGVLWRDGGLLGTALLPIVSDAREEIPPFLEVFTCRHVRLRTAAVVYLSVETNLRAGTKSLGSQWPRCAGLLPDGFREHDLLFTPIFSQMF